MPTPRLGQRRRPCTTIVAEIIAAEHEHVAVGEVDQLEDAVDERVAERRRGRTGRRCVIPIRRDSEERAPVLTRLTPSHATTMPDQQEPEAP